MDDELQEGISEITEISEYMRVAANIRVFSIALLRGTLAGGGPAALILAVPFFAVMVDSGSFDTSSLFLIAVPFLAAGAITLAAMMVIGLPLTAILKRLGKECARTYAISGLSLGILIPLVICAAVGSMEAGLFFAVFGMMAGGATALTWGRWREERAEETRNAGYAQSAAKRSNPIHDLVH